MEHINQNLAIKQIRIRLNEDAAKYILEKTASDRSYGARPLRRALQKYIEDPLSDMVIQGSLPRPSNLEVYLGDAGIYCRQIDPPESTPPESTPPESTTVEGEEATVSVGAGDPGPGGSPAVREGMPLYMFS